MSLQQIIIMFFTCSLVAGTLVCTSVVSGLLGTAVPPPPPPGIPEGEVLRPQRREGSRERKCHRMLAAVVLAAAAAGEERTR